MEAFASQIVSHILCMCRLCVIQRLVSEIRSLLTVSPHGLLWYTVGDNTLYICSRGKCNSMPFSAAWAYYGYVLVLVSAAS